VPSCAARSRPGPSSTVPPENLAAPSTACDGLRSETRRCRPWPPGRRSP
jgi:hypothetical protein